MSRRELLVLGALAALLPLLLAFSPIVQPPGYHDLADQRPLLGIPHFWNVLSNLPFLVIGVMGLLLRKSLGVAWSTVFAGTVLIAFGSTWYHLAPNDATLVWDRIPIGIAFMAFFSALISEHTHERLGNALLAPLALFSIAAVLWWRHAGDLAPWVWVQLAPMLAIVLALAFLPGRYSHRRYLGYALAWYAAAKGFELFDRQVMQVTAHLVSGHVLKHLAAAAGVWCFYVMLRDRSPVPAPATSGRLSAAGSASAAGRAPSPSAPDRPTAR